MRNAKARNRERAGSRIEEARKREMRAFKIAKARKLQKAKQRERIIWGNTPELSSELNRSSPPAGVYGGAKTQSRRVG